VFGFFLYNELQTQRFSTLQLPKSAEKNKNVITVFINFNYENRNKIENVYVEM